MLLKNTFVFVSFWRRSVHIPGSGLVLTLIDIVFVSFWRRSVHIEGSDRHKRERELSFRLLLAEISSYPILLTLLLNQG